ncbi:MAG: plasmid pRiA4b ORF-3 family protein [Bacillota bacterium]|nr:plasmid pRiA4b ORF-3 family protein [Bacillota bacterium]
MKAYIIKIELQDSNPLIWRRVIMPANATFNRLHDVIQTVTNFKSGYPYKAYHLFEFDLKKENMIVTNDKEAYEAHKHYMNNKEEYKNRIMNMRADMQKFARRQNEFLEKVVKKPKHYKISKYLEKYKIIEYSYDFGDDWCFNIILEDIVNDYYFGFPTLLDGAETAPPEDIGGIPAYYEFLKVYNNESHPDHERVREWGEGTHFRSYDPEHINMMLKYLKYQKTNWNLINHKNYMIIDDKYRKK